LICDRIEAVELWNSEDANVPADSDLRINSAFKPAARFFKILHVRVFKNVSHWRKNVVATLGERVSETLKYQVHGRGAKTHTCDANRVRIGGAMLREKRV
jgi:hypothetical protein